MAGYLTSHVFDSRDYIRKGIRSDAPFIALRKMLVTIKTPILPQRQRTSRTIRMMAQVGNFF